MSAATHSEGRWDSFEADLDVTGMDGPPYRAVFIRAPVFNSVGANVEVLSQTG